MNVTIWGNPTEVSRSEILAQWYSGVTTSGDFDLWSWGPHFYGYANKFSKNPNAVGGPIVRVSS